MRYEVIVENIGRVYEGPSKTRAKETFYEYVKLSKHDYGRAAGASVIMLNGDFIYLEYNGKESDNA